MRPSSPDDEEDEYEEAYESESDGDSDNSIPPMPPPFSPLDSSRLPTGDATGDFLDEAFPRPPPNKSNAMHSNKIEDMGFDETGSSALMGILNKEGYGGFNIETEENKTDNIPKEELRLDHEMNIFDHEDGLVGTTPTTTSHMRKGITVGGATPISNTDSLTSAHLLATPPSGHKAHFKLSTPLIDKEEEEEDDDEDEGHDQEVSDDGENELYLNTGRSSYRQRMGTARGEKSPFDSGDDDDDESEQSTEGEPDSDEELTEEQQRMAEELGMFSGTPLPSNQSEISDIFIDDDDDDDDDDNDDDNKMTKMISKHNEEKRQKDENCLLDGKKKFSLRSWSGRRKFKHEFDETGGIAEFLPPAETSEIGDRWTSPMKQSKTVPSKTNHQGEDQNNDIENDDNNDDDEESFMGGFAGELGWDRGQQPSTSPISTPKKCDKKQPLHDATNKKLNFTDHESREEEEEDEDDENFVESALFQNNNSIFSQFMTNKNAHPSNRTVEDEDDDEQHFEDDDDEEEDDDIFDEQSEDDTRDRRRKQGRNVVVEELDATEKQKKMLAELAEEKRRLKALEEEKILKLAERKKKKTEALLERARLRKAMSLEVKANPPVENNQTNKKNQKGVRGVRKTNSQTEEVSSLENDLVQTLEEADRVALIAAKRKQFKKNHKNHLNQLSAKRKQEELAKMEAEAEEEARIRNIKEKGLLRVRMHLEAERLKQQQQQASLPEQHDSPGANSGRSEGSNSGKKKNPSPGLGRGSGLEAVRAARQNSEGGDEEEMIISVAEKKERARDMRLAKEKQVELLKAMSEEAKKQKEKEELNRLRMERRAVLKKERILSDALERRRLLEEEAKGGGFNDNKEEEEEDEDGKQKKKKKSAKDIAQEKENQRLYNIRKLRQETKEKNELKKLKSKPMKKKGKDDDSDDDSDEGKPSFEEQQSAISRLAVHRKVDEGGGSASNARDFEDWKRKHGVPLEGKVFSLTGWYPCVKEALLARGWFFNSDRDSFFFDLKWTLKSNELKQDQLQPWQLTNHFLKNTAITTKVGLLKSLRQLSWFTNVHPDSIFPRCYDLNDVDDMQTFLDDYRRTTAQGMLKEVVAKCRLMDTDSVLKLASRSGKQFASEFNPEDYDASVLINSGALEVALAVCSRQSDPMLNTDEYLDSSKLVLKQPITPIEWEVLGHAAKVIYNTKPLMKKNKKTNNNEVVKLERPIFKSWKVGDLLIPEQSPVPLDAFLIPRVKEEPKNTRELQRQEREERKRKNILEIERKSLLGKVTGELEPVGLQRLEKIVQTLAKIDEMSSQCALNGRFCTKNLWIVKPSAKSRGRGIMTFRNIDKLLEYIGVGESGTSTAMWVVQKYMENPLIIAKRKFDIRQWVLVTDWNPLTIYFYNECYARFSASEYSDDDKDLENVHVHLVNNSVGKDCLDFHKQLIAENGEEIIDCMWSKKQISDFMKYKAQELGIFKGHDSLEAKVVFESMNKTEGEDEKEEKEGEDVYETRCSEKMKEIARCSLMSAQGQVEHRKNSWELYGFDYMFDDDFMPWLIEINSSPACDYSTPTTEDFVPRALTDVLKVVVDLREAEKISKDVSSVDTGGWERIYKGPTIETTKTSLGVDLACQGTPVRLKPGFRTNNKPYIQQLPCPEEQEQNNTNKENKKQTLNSLSDLQNIPKVKKETRLSSSHNGSSSEEEEDVDSNDDDKQTLKPKKQNPIRSTTTDTNTPNKMPPQFTIKHSLLTRPKSSTNKEEEEVEKQEYQEESMLDGSLSIDFDDI